MSWYLPSTTKLLSILEAYISRVGGRKFWTGIIHLFPNTNLSFLNPPAHVAEARLRSQVHCCMMETVTQVNAGGNVCHLLSHWGMGPFTYSNQFKLALCSCKILRLPEGYAILQFFAMNRGRHHQLERGVHMFGIAVVSCNSICTSSQWPTARLWREEEAGANNS